MAQLCRLSLLRRVNNRIKKGRFMAEEKKLALLIDSDNVSAKYAQFILQEASKYGELSCRRIYGDWERNVSGWRIPAMNNSILPVQQTCYVTGKNATDFSMIIDAMDLLYAGNIDGFVLVTSDSDFTRLAIRLREAGKLVVGIGEVKTPLAFTSSCHHFSYLNQVCDTVEDYDEKSLRKAVVDFVKENEDKRPDLIKIDVFIKSKFGNPDFSRFGFSRLSNFIDSFPELRRSNTFVSLKKKNPPPVTAPVQKPGGVTQSTLAAAIIDYLKANGSQNDNMMKIESHINSLFGKVDYSRFGSKRFAKFLDKVPAIVRTGTTVQLAVTPITRPKENIAFEHIHKTILEYAKNSMPDGGNLGLLNTTLMEKYGKEYVKKLGFTGFTVMMNEIHEIRIENNRVYLVDEGKTEQQDKPAEQKENISAAAETANSIEINIKPENNPPENRETKSDHADTIDIDTVKSYILEIAKNKDGIYLPALGKQLTDKFGKNYLKQLGLGSMKKLIEEIEGVSVKNNKLELNDIASDIPVTEQNKPDNVPDTGEDPANRPKKSEKPEKIDFNSVKRDILSQAAQSDGGISLSALGKILSEKYGKEYLKELGFGSMKKLLSEISGVSVNDNKLSLDEEFLNRTDSIERFVYEFVRSEGKCSIKSLSSQIKKNFAGFDFTDYGYSKFSDFINAIDGVRAVKYYVEPVD